VNLGKLGFLAESSTEDLQRVLTDILEHRYMVEERLVLQATTTARPGTAIHAVNDIVVDKSRSSRLIDVETHIDDAFAVTYRGDGLIISTPTGSTGYALSNGGPIVTPTCRVLGITPIAPHTLNGRPLIIPESSVIRIVVHSHNDEVLLSADGQSELVARPPLEVIISRAPYPLRLVKRIDRTYFDVLRAKLFWGQDARSM
jgi:NAD+ kinase